MVISLQVQAEGNSRPNIVHSVCEGFKGVWMEPQWQRKLRLETAHRQQGIKESLQELFNLVVDGFCIVFL